MLRLSEVRHAQQVSWHLSSPEFDKALDETMIGSKEQTDEYPKPFRFMDLPRELRDEVYRGLLLPTQILGQRSDVSKCSSRMNPAILRVSGQTYKESSRVLYAETNWVLITTFDDQEDHFIRFLKKAGYSFNSVQRTLCFPGTPVLRIEMTSSLNANLKYQASILVPQPALQFIGITFMAHHCVRIALRFDEDAMQKCVIREALLHFCKDLRGVPSVTIEGVNPRYCAELTDIMRTPICVFGEHIERVKTYHQLARHQLAQGRLLDAFLTNFGGSFYAGWAGRREIRRRLPGSDLLNIKLKEEGINSLIAAAYCSSKAGNPGKARNLLDSLLPNGSPFQSPTKLQEIDIHYHKALTFLAENDNLNAAKELCFVLNVQPGHEDADKQLDAMEARLPIMPQIERCKIEAYLKDGVEQYRHREPGSTRPSEVAVAIDGLLI